MLEHPSFSCSPLASYRRWRPLWLISLLVSHCELTLRPFGKPGVCQATLGSHMVTANVSKPPAHHCPTSLIAAVIGCKGSSCLAHGGSGDLNCVCNFKAYSFTETTQKRLILLDSNRKVCPCDVSLSRRSEDM